MSQGRRGSGGAPGGGPGEGQGRAGGGTNKHGASSPWEWVVAAASALVVLAAIGFMLYDGVGQPRTPPRVEIEVEAVREAEPGQFLVRFRARNRGHETAANLLVQGELVSDTGTVETAEVTLPYLPAQSARRGGLYFYHDPRRFALRIRPRGYDRP